MESECELTCAAATGMATSHVRHVRDAAVTRSAHDRYIPLAPENM